MRWFWGWSGALSLLLLAAMAATLPTPLGASPWHHHAALAAVVAGSLAGWRPLAHRRVATLSMAFAGVPAVATGFAMLYTRQVSAKEWLTWWHGATSFAFMAAFLAH